MPREFQNPVIPVGLPAYEHASLLIAREQLGEEIRLFHRYFEVNGEDATRAHNVFGELNYYEWLWFHYKHAMHHFMQFGVVPLSEKIQ